MNDTSQQGPAAMSAMLDHWTKDGYVLPGLPCHPLQVLSLGEKHRIISVITGPELTVTAQTWCCREAVAVHRGDESEKVFEVLAAFADGSTEGGPIPRSIQDGDCRLSVRGRGVEIHFVSGRARSW